MKSLIISGTRGIPASHGGFETFAEKISLYLVSNNWRVIVYCQKRGRFNIFIDKWNGVDRVNISLPGEGALSTIIFDLISVVHSVRYRCLVLTLGYNTALFNIIYKFFSIKNIINMDGIEWKRNKWSFIAKLWLRLNEYVATKTADHLIADHPEIKNYLLNFTSSDNISMIPYGGIPCQTCISDLHYISAIDSRLKSRNFFVVIARPEPENSILEIVASFSSIDRDDIYLVVLGNIVDTDNDYHSLIINSASGNVIFPGSIYSSKIISSLRSHALAYIHGHTVGGTNPSLVEALAASSAVIAHDNRFNQWVASSSALYFSSNVELKLRISHLIDNPQIASQYRVRAFERYLESFTWEKIFITSTSLFTSFDV